MSTKTNFKRIALVAVAALGLGVLSSVPSQAAVSSLTITVGANGTATTKVSDSSTAATIDVTFLKSAAMDTVAVSAVMKSSPTGAATISPTLMWNDSSTANPSRGQKTPGEAASTGIIALKGNDTVTAGGSITISPVDTTSAASAYVTGNFKVHLDTSTAGANTALKAGTYTITVVATPFNGGTANSAGIVTKDLTYTVTTATDSSLTTSAVYSTAVLSQGSADAGSTIDSAVAVLSTASASASAVILVTLKNASNTAIAGMESVTVTTTLGNVGTGGSGAYGKSVTLQYASTSLLVDIRPEGVAGVATIQVSTPTITFPAKRVIFYSPVVKTLNATKLLNSLGVGANTHSVLGVAKDAAGNANASSTNAVFAYSSDTAVVSNYGSVCAYVDAYGGQVCSLTGVKEGTAKITLRDSSTVATSTVASTEVIEVRVTSQAAASVKLAFDKTSYAPNEKAYITVTVLDASGKSLSTQAASDFLASGGITANVSFGNGSDTLTASNFATAQRNASAPLSVEPVKAYTVFMPATGASTVTITAKGGTALPIAGQVSVTASATVTDSGAAALAAVTALATTVASLRTLITTLTNLVLKIQKKVKA
jgi:hypothetical protein